MANTYYFSHDFDASSDIKMMKLLRVYKSAGTGLFWRLTELLYQNDNLLNCDYETLSYDLREDIVFVKDVIENYDLFVIENDKFYSESVGKRLDKRNEKSNRARDNANKRWGKDANALQTECKGNAIKESKVKESKVKEIKENIIINNSSFSKTCLSDKQWMDVVSMQNKKLKGNVEVKLIEFDNWLISTGTAHEDIKKYKSHFINWVNISKNTQDKNPKKNIVF